MKYFLVAGEASGDLHAANLMAAIKRKDPDAQFKFLGGDRMAEHGGEPITHYRNMAYMGIVAVVMHARSLMGILDGCKKAILDWEPDVLILVDYASFNLRVAAYIKRHRPNLPIHFYIAPKLWAWKTYRIRAFRRHINALYVIFPFEPAFFEKHAYKALYVGNPSVDSVAAFKAVANDSALFRHQYGLDDRPILALLPGSRLAEIRSNLSIMMTVAAKCPDFQIVVAGAPGVNPDVYSPFLPASTPLVFNATYDLLKAAHVAMVTSGTATLETALFGVPQVVCYAVKGGDAANWAFDHFMKVPFFSLVNLIAGKAVVPELMGGRLKVENLTAALMPLLTDTPERLSMLNGYATIQSLLGEPGAADRTAMAICSSLGIEKAPSDQR
jgi:lipid-A-disaccharide synthase